MQGADVIVIGAGIAGTAAAAELAAEADVILLEAEEQPGYHATGRSAAMYVVDYGPPDVQRLTRAGGAFFRAPPAGFAEQPLIGPRGVMLLARPGDEGHLRELVARSQGLRAISLDEARRLVQLLRPEAVGLAAYEADGPEIDVAALHQGFLRQLRRRGGRLVTRARCSALTHGQGRWHLETAAGAFAAPLIVNAAGAWVDEIARAAGLAPLGFVPKRRTAAIIDGPPGEPGCAHWPLVLDAREQWYCRPEAGRKLLVSPADATPSEPCDAQPEEIDIAVGIDRFQQAIDLEVRRVEHSWAGLRTFSPDGSLVIGFDPRADGFFWLAGQGGYGIQTAPAAAQLTRALIAGEALPAPLVEAEVSAERLSPGRFLH